MSIQKPIFAASAGPRCRNSRLALHQHPKVRVQLRSLGWEPLVTLNEGLKKYRAWIECYGTLSEYFSEAEKLLRKTNVIQDTK